MDANLAKKVDRFLLLCAICFILIQFNQLLFGYSTHDDILKLINHMVLLFSEIYVIESLIEWFNRKKM